MYSKQLNRYAVAAIALGFLVLVGFLVLIWHFPVRVFNKDFTTHGQFSGTFTLLWPPNPVQDILTTRKREQKKFPKSEIKRRRDRDMRKITHISLKVGDFLLDSPTISSRFAREDPSLAFDTQWPSIEFPVKMQTPAAYRRNIEGVFLPKLSSLTVSEGVALLPGEELAFQLPYVPGKKRFSARILPRVPGYFTIRAGKYSQTYNFKPEDTNRIVSISMTINDNTAKKMSVVSQTFKGRILQPKLAQWSQRGVGTVAFPTGTKDWELLPQDTVPYPDLNGEDFQDTLNIQPNIQFFNGDEPKATGMNVLFYQWPTLEQNELEFILRNKSLFPFFTQFANVAQASSYDPKVALKHEEIFKETIQLKENTLLYTTLRWFGYHTAFLGNGENVGMNNSEALLNYNLNDFKGRYLTETDSALVAQTKAMDTPKEEQSGWASLFPALAKQPIVNNINSNLLNWLDDSIPLAAYYSKHFQHLRLNDYILTSTKSHSLQSLFATFEEWINQDSNWRSRFFLHSVMPNNRNSIPVSFQTLLKVLATDTPSHRLSLEDVRQAGRLVEVDFFFQNVDWLLKAKGIHHRTVLNFLIPVNTNSGIKYYNYMRVPGVKALSKKPKDISHMPLVEVLDSIGVDPSKLLQQEDSKMPVGLNSIYRYHIYIVPGKNCKPFEWHVHNQGAFFNRAILSMQAKTNRSSQY